MTFPQSPKCLSEECRASDNGGVLIPLSDFGPDGATVPFKAWVCTNPACGFSLRIDKGEVSYGRPVGHQRSSDRGNHHTDQIAAKGMLVERWK